MNAELHALPRSRRAPAALLSILLSLVVMATVAVTAGPASAAGAGTTGAVSATDEATFVTHLNQARVARGLPRLASRTDLVKVARAQARRMATKNVLYHNPTLTSDVRNWRWVGENVGYGPTADGVHTAFMNSAPHRANILDTDYTEVGIGVVVVSGRVWVAEVFRRPMSAGSGFSAPKATGKAVKVTFTHTLKVGSKGAAVNRVQGRLGVARSGHYGRATKHAVTHFQRAQGWRGSGKVGHRTWKRLF